MEDEDVAWPMALTLSEAISCNNNQVGAIKKLREGIFLIHGPPGPGANHFDGVIAMSSVPGVFWNDAQQLSLPHMAAQHKHTLQAR